MLEPGPRAPLLQLVLMGLAAFVLALGGSLTLGTWGDLDARLVMAYVLPALALHAWSTASGRRRTGARAAAWGLAFAMAAHTQALLRPDALAVLGTLAALDLALYARRPVGHAAKRPLRDRAAAAAGLGGALVMAAWLALNAPPEVALRLGLAALATGTLAAGLALRPALRAPRSLLPLLAAHYLLFALVAAPVLPLGPAVAWWVLCLSVLAGALAAARHVSGAEAPPHARHEHREAPLPDPLVRACASELERFLATGRASPALAARLARAVGPGPAQTLLSKAHSPGARERALREALGVMP